MTGRGRDATFCVLSLLAAGHGWFQTIPFNDETQNVASRPRSPNPLRDEYECICLVGIKNEELKIRLSNF